MGKFNLSWLKLDVNILDDTKIKIIRKYPDGNELFILWIGLLCLGMKSEDAGRIFIADGIPYGVDELANEFDIKTKTVELGLSVFKKYKMIDIDINGIIEVLNFGKHQELEKIEYKRKQNAERQKVYKAKLKSNALLTSDCCVSTPIRVEESRKEEKRIEESKIEKNFYFESDDKTLNLTELQKNNLLDKFKNIDIDYYIEKIVVYNESKPKSKKYKSLNLTLQDWIKNDIERNGKYFEIYSKSKETSQIVEMWED